MPLWLTLLINYGPRVALVIAKLLLKNKPEWLAIVEGLIKDIDNPDVPNPIARQSALLSLKQCQGVGCPSDVKQP